MPDKELEDAQMTLDELEQVEAVEETEAVDEAVDETVEPEAEESEAVESTDEADETEADADAEAEVEKPAEPAEPVKEEAKPEDKPEADDKAVDSAPLSVVRKLREQKRAERTAREAAEAKNRELEAQLAASKAKPEPDPIDELDPDQPLTVKEVNAILAKERAVNEQRAIAAKHEHLRRDEQAFSQQMTPDKTGEGLDYETVTMLGQENLSPSDIRSILASGNPAKLGYELCIKRTPELYELYRKNQERTKIIDKAPAAKPLSKPVVKPVVSKPQVNPEKQKYTPDELRAIRLL